MSKIDGTGKNRKVPKFLSILIFADIEEVK